MYKILFKEKIIIEIITPFGRFKYKKLPFGINSATEIFQECFEEVFGDIEGVDIDDLRIIARNQHEHNIILEKVLQRAQERNIKFNIEKCNISCNEIKYTGHFFSNKGIKVD